MAEVVLYHHIQGLTEGVRSFADELRRRGTRSTPLICSTGARSPRWTRPSPSFGRRATRSTRRRTVSRRRCRTRSSTQVSRGVSAPRSGSPRHAPARVGRSSTKRASRSRANTPSAPGPPECPFKSMARPTTSSSPTRATSMPPANSSRWPARPGRTLRLPRRRAPLRRLLAPELRPRRDGARRGAHRALPLPAVIGSCRVGGD